MNPPVKNEFEIMNNDNQQIPEGMDPETLDMINSLCDPSELERFKQFSDKIGAAGMLDLIRAETECPVDALIASVNSGSRTPKLRSRMMKALAASEVFIIYCDDKPSVMPTQKGLVVFVFTRESHINKFIDDNISVTVTTKKVSIADLFLTILPERYFTMHVNPDEGRGIFEIVIPSDMVDLLYNLSVHGDEAIRRFCVETGKGPDQLRYKHLYGYDPQKPWENYTHKELNELAGKLVACLLEAGHEPRPFERRLLDMVQLQLNKNLCNPANMTEADFWRMSGLTPPSSGGLF